MPKQDNIHNSLQSFKDQFSVGFEAALESKENVIQLLKDFDFLSDKVLQDKVNSFIRKSQMTPKWDLFTQAVLCGELIEIIRLLNSKADDAMDELVSKIISNLTNKKRNLNPAVGKFETNSDLIEEYLKDKNNNLNPFYSVFRAQNIFQTEIISLKEKIRESKELESSQKEKILKILEHNHPISTIFKILQVINFNSFSKEEFYFINYFYMKFKKVNPSDSQEAGIDQTYEGIKKISITLSLQTTNSFISDIVRMKKKWKNFTHINNAEIIDQLKELIRINRRINKIDKESLTLEELKLLDVKAKECLHVFFNNLKHLIELKPSANVSAYGSRVTGDGAAWMFLKDKGKINFNEEKLKDFSKMGDILTKSINKNFLFLENDDEQFIFSLARKFKEEFLKANKDYELEVCLDKWEKLKIKADALNIKVDDAIHSELDKTKFENFFEKIGENYEFSEMDVKECLGKTKIFYDKIKLPSQPNDNLSLDKIKEISKAIDNLNPAIEALETKLKKSDEIKKRFNEESKFIETHKSISGLNKRHEALEKKLNQTFEAEDVVSKDSLNEFDSIKRELVGIELVNKSEFCKKRFDSINNKIETMRKKISCINLTNKWLKEIKDLNNRSDELIKNLDSCFGNESEFPEKYLTNLESIKAELSKIKNDECSTLCRERISLLEAKILEIDNKISNIKALNYLNEGIKKLNEVKDSLDSCGETVTYLGDAFKNTVIRIVESALKKVEEVKKSLKSSDYSSKFDIESGLNSIKAHVEEGSDFKNIDFSLAKLEQDLRDYRDIPEKICSFLYGFSCWVRGEGWRCLPTERLEQDTAINICKWIYGVLTWSDQELQGKQKATEKVIAAVKSVVETDQNNVVENTGGQSSITSSAHFTFFSCENEKNKNYDSNYGVSLEDTDANLNQCEV